MKGIAEFGLLNADWRANGPEAKPFGMPAFNPQSAIRIQQ
jgi:hypothetical protein